MVATIMYTNTEELNMNHVCKLQVYNSFLKHIMMGYFKFVYLFTLKFRNKLLKICVCQSGGTIQFYR